MNLVVLPGLLGPATLRILLCCGPALPSWSGVHRFAIHPWPFALRARLQRFKNGGAVFVDGQAYNGDGSGG